MRLTNSVSPCPYCGGEGIIRFSRDFCTPYIDAIHKKRCKMRPSTWLWADRDINYQIKMWNMRSEENV